MKIDLLALATLMIPYGIHAFPQQAAPASNAKTQLSASLDRRDFGNAVWGLATTAAALPGTANAQVFLDPAMYGDQELRIAAVDSLKERVRRAILQKPELAPSFYQLALLDSLSFNAQTKQFGPDGSVIKVALSSKATDNYTKNLQSCCLTLIESSKALKKYTAVTLADAVAIGGSEAIESIGGPVLSVQLGRTDAPLEAPVSNLPLDLFNGKYGTLDMTKYFQQAGVTEREMTALLSGLFTIESVEKARTTEDWKMSVKPKFREPGKMGRMSEFRPLTEEDIAEAEAQAELEADPDYEDPDDGWYIADSFGSRDERFGDRLGKDEITEKTFNTYLKNVMETYKSKKTGGDVSQYGWIPTLLLDPNAPTSQQWLNKYAGSNLNYLKDLSFSYNAITQLGAVYTGGKYEALLKDKKRKSLNNDDLNLF